MPTVLPKSDQTSTELLGCREKDHASIRGCRPSCSDDSFRRGADKTDMQDRDFAYATGLVYSIPAFLLAASCHSPRTCFQGPRPNDAYIHGAGEARWQLMADPIVGACIIGLCARRLLKPVQAQGECRILSLVRVGRRQRQNISRTDLGSSIVN